MSIRIHHDARNTTGTRILTATQTATPIPPVVVHSPSFSPDIGGVIVLHYLVDRLRSIGVEAYVAPIPREYPEIKSRVIRYLKHLNHRRKQRRAGPFQTHPAMNVSLAPPTLPSDAIAIYPEIVVGNPAAAKVVVRWVLYKNGFSGGDDPGPDDLIFYYQEGFLPALNGRTTEGQLRIRWLRDDIYVNRNSGPRQGACRMIRKGETDAGTGPADAVILDGKSHEEIAAIFNQCDLFYCHDLYTMYCYYAVLCGCTPVVIPAPGLSSESWREGFELKNGVAYGEDEIPWARRTRQALINDMAVAKLTELNDVHKLAECLRVVSSSRDEKVGKR